MTPNIINTEIYRGVLWGLGCVGQIGVKIGKYLLGVVSILLWWGEVDPQHN